MKFESTTIHTQHSTVCHVAFTSTARAAAGALHSQLQRRNSAQRRGPQCSGSHVGALPRPVLTLISACCLALSCPADELQLDLPQLNSPFSADRSLTFTGNGFLTAWGSSYFNGFSIDNAHSYLQANISALATKSIHSATLSFYVAGLLDTNVVLTSFATTGTLGFHLFPPSVISSRNITVNGGNTPPGSSAGTLNVIDVKDMLKERLAAASSFLGLHFIGSTLGLYNNNPDDTHLRLNIVYGDVADAAPTIAVVVEPRVKLAWSSTTNKFYQVQYSLDLKSNSWVDIGPPVSGTGQLIIRKYDLDAQTGFYRVKIFE